MRLLVPTLLFLLLAAVPPLTAHNITRILAQHPDFSTFNHYLSATHLAAEINRRETITVLALPNSAMATVLSKHLSLFALRNLLSLHVLVDYFGARKLHQITSGSALSSTLYQASGAAPGMSGFVNITDRRAGHVTFHAASGPGSGSSSVTFVKSIKEIPYNISVLEISAALASPAAEAPTPAPSQINLTSAMSAKGCKTFSDLIISTADVEKTYTDNVASGLTVFCPIDQAMKAFLPKFKNLTADGKVSLLLYQAMPVYESMEMLKSGNGVVNTLATDGTSKNYNITVQNDGEVVTLRSRATKAKITGTVVDEDPLAVYTTDAVLEPRELFKKAVLAPALAPAPAAHKKKGKGKAKAKGKEKGEVPAPEPAGPEAEPADQMAADDSAGVVARWSAAAAASAAALLLMVI